MAWYLRKSASLGPLRFNLSRSGVGASVGIPGFRIGVGPRGSYLHAGRGGLYYRQRLGPAGGGAAAPTPDEGAPAADELRAIESASAAALTDTADEFLAALRRAATRHMITPWVVAVALGAGAGLWWLDITRVEIFGGLLAVTLGGLWWARRLDHRRTHVALSYELAPDVDTWFRELVRAFEQWAGCAAVWHIPAEAGVRDRKRHAGATRTIERQRIQPSMGTPRHVICPLEVPVLPAGRQTLYLFPDYLLVYEGREIGAIAYDSLKATTDTVNFIEEETLPGDAEVVGQTWRYVNKSGGPDRRFRDNRQLPLAKYGRLLLRTASGLNEEFQCSQAARAEALAIRLTAGSPST